MNESKAKQELEYLEERMITLHKESEQYMANFVRLHYLRGWLDGRRGIV